MDLSTTRRGFLGGALGAGLAVQGQGAPTAPGDFTLGVASYSLREFSRGLAIRMLQQLKVDNVSVKEFHLPYRATPEDLARGAKQFADAGIKISSGGVVYMMKDDERDIRSYFDYARTCGMPMLLIGATEITLPKIEKCVKEYNIPVAIHNHGPEDKHFPTPEVALKAIQGMDPRVGVCVDLGHTYRAGQDAVESLVHAGKRLLGVHIKDLRVLRDGESQCPVGEGAFPIPTIFKTLRQIGYQGYVDLEYEIEGDSPLLGMGKSMSYMRGVLAAQKAS